jgi:hypothetical protein
MNLRDAAQATSCTRSFFSNSFASSSFRTLAAHLKAAVSSNPFAIKRFGTLCKIPGIGYPPPSLFSPLRFTQNSFCGGSPALATHPRHIPHGNENSIAGTPLESALIQVLILNSLKLFRMNTYEKHRGEGVLLLTRHPTKDVCPERPTGAEGSLRVAQQFLAVLLHQSPPTGRTSCTLPLRPAILDGYSMKRRGHNFSGPILSSPRPGRSQNRKGTLFTSHESPVTSHGSRAPNHV